MPVQQERAPTLHGNALQHDLQRQQIAHLLSDMHLRLDECWFTGADTGRVQADIERIEREHAALFCPCHLCAKPTVFRDACYDLPFCWHCLQERYDRWYCSVRYNRASGG